MLVGGMGLALAQGWANALQLPDPFGDAVQLISLFLPPMLIARGGHRLTTTTGFGRWLHERVAKPLSAFATRLLSGGHTRHAIDGSLADAPTEMLLVRAVESAVGALPVAHRDSMGQVDAIARSLAAEATGLRAQSRQLDAREAEALVMRDSLARAAALDAVRHERQVVLARLQTTMAALESLRLDVLQLTADRTDSGLTAQLNEVREVQRRVDAALSVRRLLHGATPT